MRQSPRPYSQAFFSGKEWLTSLVQGLVIALGVLMVYRYATFYQFSEDLTRTMVFVALIFANITLTLVNRSFYYSIFTTLKYKNNLVPAIIAITLVLTFCLVYVDVLATFFDFESLDGFQLAVCFMMGTLSVIWFEIAKWIRRRRADNQAVVEKVA
jgi:Ca2+-transporting ATPase